MKKKVKKDFYNEMTTSERKQAFFRWLLKKGVGKGEAAKITHRKFFHGDPFESNTNDF